MFVSPLGSSGTPVVPVTSVVTLSGENIVSFGIGAVWATLWINADGTLWKQTSDGGSTQIDAATDWIIPNEDADSTYEVRYTNHGGLPLYQLGDIAVEDTWVDLSETRMLTFVTWTISGEPLIATFDLEIRKDGGDVLATASYSLSAHRLW